MIIRTTATQTIAAEIIAAHRVKNSENTLLRIFFLCLELVAYAPDCLERPLVRNIFKLFTKTLDMNVDSTGVAVILKATYLVKKLISCINTVRVGSEVEEEFKLLRRCIHNLSVNTKLISCHIDNELVIADFLYLGLGAALTDTS